MHTDNVYIFTEALSLLAGNASSHMPIANVS